MYSQMKMSHSIHMLSIQIDTQSLKIGYFNIIKLSFFALQAKRKEIFHHFCLLDKVEKLD